MTALRYHEVSASAVFEVFEIQGERDALRRGGAVPAVTGSAGAGRQIVTDWRQIPGPAATSLTEAPLCPEGESARRDWCRIGGTIAVAGVVAENLVREAKHFPLLPTDAIERSAGDWRNFTHNRAEPGARLPSGTHVDRSVV